jgi:F-type H+-transporting ATPase subunit epsilon
MDELILEIVTPERLIFKEQIDSVIIPGTLGSFQILKNHAPLVSTFEVGIINVKKNSSDSRYTTGGGTVEVNNNKVLVLADSIEKINDIDIDRAEKARKRAEERLKNKQEENIDEARAQSALSRAINRINAVKKYKI